MAELGGKCLTRPPVFDFKRLEWAFFFNVTSNCVFNERVLPNSHGRFSDCYCKNTSIKSINSFLTEFSDNQDLVFTNVFHKCQILLTS